MCTRMYLQDDGSGNVTLAYERMEDILKGVYKEWEEKREKKSEIIHGFMDTHSDFQSCTPTYKCSCCVHVKLCA